MKVLLTGASGFIGAHVARWLLDRNHDLAVVALPDDPLNRLACLRDRLNILLAPLEATGAIRDAVRKFQPETCIHLAWYAEPGQYFRFYELNDDVLRFADEYFSYLNDCRGQHDVVLGDGRSNGADPRLDLFAELALRAKRLVWLCPEPPGRWGSGDSGMLQYRPHCSHVSHCATAADLERAIDEALEAYD